MFPQKTFTLTELADKAIKWYNNLTPNQIFGLSIIAAMIIAENTPRTTTYNYYVKPKPLPRKKFSNADQSLARFRQGQVCDICKRYTDVWDYHHKDGNRANNSLGNCQALCPNCHAKIHRKSSANLAPF